MTEQREEGIRENCIKVLTGEPELDEVAFCLEEKKAEAESITQCNLLRGHTSRNQTKQIVEP